VTTIDREGTGEACCLDNQSDIEDPRALARPLIAAFDVAGFEPGGFSNGLTDNRRPIAGNVGLTYRF